tara:strand:+ start:2872 stop:3798 length:927 start_codon:yes stop_codon:yes gene_type:complete
LLNNITSKIINFFVISNILLLINSCTYFRLKELDKYTFSENNIYDLISKEYKDFAKFELYEMYDELDANYFAFKASNTLKTKKIILENPLNWKIPYNSKEEAKKEYQKLKTLLSNNIIFKHPKITAHLVIGYDCWLEQLEENWQFEDIKNCKDKYTTAYNKLLSYINASTIVENKETINTESDLQSKENKSNISKNKKEKTVIVYFNHDSYKLDLVQKNKLDKFIFNFLKNNNSLVIIYGHTDTKGSKKYNLLLSKKRANNVYEYFKTMGVDNKLILKGYGESYPVVDTGDEVQEEKNRRAEIIINYQ